MDRRKVLLNGLIGGGMSVVIGAMGIVIAQGLWAVAHSPASIGHVMFGG